MSPIRHFAARAMGSCCGKDLAECKGGVAKHGARVVGDRDVARATIGCKMAVNPLF